MVFGNPVYSIASRTSASHGSDYIHYTIPEEPPESINVRDLPPPASPDPPQSPYQEPLIDDRPMWPRAAADQTVSLFQNNSFSPISSSSLEDSPSPPPRKRKKRTTSYRPRDYYPFTNVYPEFPRKKEHRSFSSESDSEQSDGMSAETEIPSESSIEILNSVSIKKEPCDELIKEEPSIKLEQTKDSGKDDKKSAQYEHRPQSRDSHGRSMPSLSSRIRAIQKSRRDQNRNESGAKREEPHLSTLPKKETERGVTEPRRPHNKDTRGRPSRREDRSSSPEEGEINDSKRSKPDKNANRPPRPTEERSRDQRPTREGRRSSPSRRRQRSTSRPRAYQQEGTHSSSQRKRCYRLSCPSCSRDDTRKNESSSSKRRRDQRIRCSPSRQRDQTRRNNYSSSRRRGGQQKGPSSRNKNKNKRDKGRTNRRSAEAQSGESAQNLKDRLMKMLSEEGVLLINTAQLRDAMSKL